MKSHLEIDKLNLDKMESAIKENEKNVIVMTAKVDKFLS